MVDCGSAVVYKRLKTPLPAFKMPDSVKGWQRSYFYARNRTDTDRIGLLAFSLAPSAWMNWDVKIRGDRKEVDRMVSRVQELVGEGLVAKDLTLC